MMQTKLKKEGFYKFPDAFENANSRTQYFFYILLTFLILLSFSVYSQKSSVSFQHFNIEKGMSSAAIGSIYQDHTGYLWFITDKGLDKFDGYNFINYKYPKKEKVNSRIFPRTICEDRQGNIWIASYNGGIEKFDPQKETFRNFLPEPNQPATAWCNTVISLYIDQNDVMWIGTGYGLYKFKINTETFTSFRHNQNDPFSLGHNSVNAIYEDKSGTLWLATGGGLERYDRETNRFLHYWHYPNNQWYDLKTNKYWLLSITEDEEGTLWLASDGGLVEFNKIAEKFTLYDNIPSSVYTQSTKSIKSICYNGSEYIWLSTNFGLSAFNKKTKTFLNYIHSENDPGSLSSNDISDLFFDRTGSLWIGTNNGGLNKLDVPNPLFNKHVFNPLTKANLPSDYVSEIYQDIKSKIWISTNKGMKIYDPWNEATISKYTFVNRLIFHDKSGNILVVPQNNGLYKFNSDGNWTCYQDSNTAIYPERIYAFFHGNNNQYWLGNVKGDLYLLNPSTNKIKVITNIGSTIWTIYEDSKGLVWFGGYSTGLFCYDQNKKSIIQYNSIHDNQSTLIDNTIWSFFEDKNSTL